MVSGEHMPVRSDIAAEYKVALGIRPVSRSRSADSRRMTSPRGVRKRLNLPTDLSTPYDARSLLSVVSGRIPPCYPFLSPDLSLPPPLPPPLSLSLSPALYANVSPPSPCLCVFASLSFFPLSLCLSCHRSRLRSRLNSVDSLHSRLASLAIR